MPGLLIEEQPRQPPPIPLSLPWLIAYGNFKGPRPKAIQELPLPPEEGKSGGDGEAPRGEAVVLLRVEPESRGPDETYVLRRAGPFGSCVSATEFRMLERESRVYSDILGSSCWIRPPQATTLIQEARIQPPEANDSDLAPSLQGDEAPQPEGIFGQYEVVYPRVGLRTLPGMRALAVGVLHAGNIVRGHANYVDGEAWLRIDQESIERLKLKCSRAFAPLTGRRVGLGDRALLKRMAGEVCAAPEAWFDVDVAKWSASGYAALRGAGTVRGSGAFAAAELRREPSKMEPDFDVRKMATWVGDCLEAPGQEFKTKAGRKWRFLYYCLRMYGLLVKIRGQSLVIPSLPKWEKLIDLLQRRTIRVPACYSSYWARGAVGGEWSGYNLVLERLPAPAWIRPGAGSDAPPECTLLQAERAMECLAKMHTQFAASGHLDALSWLPILPLDSGRPAWLQEQFRTSFRRLRGDLEELLPPAALEACDHLADGGLAEVMVQLSLPPLDLLHGDYRPGNLKFSNVPYSPSVASEDWRFISRGKGAYDVATFLAFCARPGRRREVEEHLIKSYLSHSDVLTKTTSQKIMQLFRGEETHGANHDAFMKDVKAGFLANLAFWILRYAGPLEAGADAATRGVVWLALAVDDHDCLDLLVDDAVSECGSPKRKKKRATKRRPKSRAKRAGSQSPAAKARSTSRKDDKGGSSKSPAPKAKKKPSGSPDADEGSKPAAKAKGRSASPDKRAKRGK
eukprot:TRINITY_DN24308_c0_g1_i1.p1 TRINITY_DN24308_c0_g1~~TRINITY_DN24308_c0_g1_i1.p1  ORF type:complete len:739 (+),score=133.04 TRINITY_DN24308_c0_g1_i1:87-2303(+)